MSARKRKPRPPARAALGELHDFGPLIADELDRSAMASARNRCDCGLDGRWQVCPVCRERITERPVNRLLVAQEVRLGLDSLRTRGAVLNEIDALERMTFGLLLGICQECAQRLQATGRLRYPGPQAPENDETDDAA